MFRCLLSDFFVRSARNSCDSCVSPVCNEPCYLVAPGFFCVFMSIWKKNTCFWLEDNLQLYFGGIYKKNLYSTVEYIAPVLSLRSIIQQALIKFSVYNNKYQSVKFVNTL